jgi:iron-sulfur cluster repair protein YtfE (RIC family)
MSPVAATAFATARALILAQHHDLRGLLRTGAVLAGAASRGDRPCLNELPNLIESLRDKFKEHVTFEEATLAPVLRKGDSQNASRADRLAEEHRRQLRELDFLLRLASDYGDPESVAFSFQQLLNVLLADMGEEEQWLLQIEDRSDQQPSVC